MSFWLLIFCGKRVINKNDTVSFEEGKMPKVSEEYFVEKRNAILDCAMLLVKEMPLYAITMRNLIKRLGFSQGVIYRYYKSVDEIFIDLMNREIADIEIWEDFDKTLAENISFKKCIVRLFEDFANYVYQVQSVVGGKFYYEIQSAYMFDNEKQKTLLTKLIYKKNLEMIQEKMVTYIVTKIDEGTFRLKYPMESFIEYICSGIDGICDGNAVRMEMGQVADDTRIKEQFRMLAEYCVSCIEEKYIE